MPPTKEAVDTWLAVYREVLGIVNGLDRDTLLFRGHGGVTWPLLPSLARARKVDDVRVRFPTDHAREQTLYFDFVLRAGELLPDRRNSWEVAFAMQHHGLPTRLLDWSDTFAVALYFAPETQHGRLRRMDS